MEENTIDIQRHSFAHVMAAAVKAVMNEKGIEPQFAIGPSIENGFYYDFDLGEGTLSEEDLPKIEKKMKYIIKQAIPFEREELPIDEALERVKGQVYKEELIKDLQTEGETSVSFYKLGEVFDDLCRGPHVEHTGKLGVFKLTKIAGAYWKGDENNIMLQRIYGVSFEKQKELDDYIQLRAEAAKRDHRKLGKELDLFVFSDLVGSGLPMYTPKGTAIIDALQQEVERICRQYGVQKVMAPHIAKIDLYKLSGHAEKFSDELFKVQGHYKQDLVLKPVQCPHHTQIYASRPRSYRDLPIRYMESNKQYRDEKPGEIGGLTRVIAITVEDGHNFCTVDQIKDEAKVLTQIIKEFYSSIGLWGNHWVSLSVRDYDHPEKYIGKDEGWEKAEQMLQEISDELKLDAKKMEGEAALYGPKLDFMFKDALGNERQLATVQLDFATPERFGLVYTDENGKEVTPVMVHRAILGSYERFLAILIEHFAGAFPVWLSPVQVKIVPVVEKFNDYANKVKEELAKVNIRVEVDDSDDTLGKKVRNAEKEKSPYILVVGEKEVESNQVAVRKRSEGDLGSESIDSFVEKVLEEIKDRK